MSEVKYKYYRASGRSLEALEQFIAKRKVVHAHLLQCTNELGLKPEEAYHYSGVLAEVKAASPPGRDFTAWRKLREGWWVPRRSSPAGKALVARFEEAGRYPSRDELDKALTGQRFDLYESIGNGRARSLHIATERLADCWYFIVPDRCAAAPFDAVEMTEAEFLRAKADALDAGAEGVTP
jgi:hypothetical protein